MLPKRDANPHLLHVRSRFEQYDYPEARGIVSLNWDFDIARDHATETATRAMDAATRMAQTWVRSLKAQAEEHHIPVNFLERMAEDSQPQGVSRFIPQPGALAGPTLCQVAEEQGADLIVLGYRREWELKKLLFGQCVQLCHALLHQPRDDCSQLQAQTCGRGTGAGTVTTGKTQSGPNPITRCL